MSDRKTMRQRYLDSLAFYQNEPQWDEGKLKTAICLTMLEDYTAAKRAFKNTLDDFLYATPKWWLITNQPHWLTDTYVLADSSTMYDETWRELNTFKLAPRPGLWGLYAYGSLCLAGGKDAEALTFTLGLLAKPKYKDMFATGQAIQAIISRDHSGFNQAISDLLLAHRGMAKFGGLRETPEGYLCLPAMALSKVALDRGMIVNVESEFFSQGYLEYLQRDR